MAGLRPGPDTDALYAALVGMHEGLGAEESLALLARLVLLLANEVGDNARVREIMALARQRGDA
jgi:hypothetical protein